MVSSKKSDIKGGTIPYNSFASNGLNSTHYIVENILPKGMLIAVTAPSGHGKTAICIRIAFCVAMGIDVHTELKVERHMVIFMAGENPRDIALRFEAVRTTTPIGIDQNNQPIFASREELGRWLRIVPERFGMRDEQGDLSESAQYLIDDIKDNLIKADEDVRKAGLGLIVIDTAAAFNSDAVFDENNNAQQLATARAMRHLVEDPPGNPCVLALCHASKGSTKETLSARGASSFLAECDGQLLIWQHGKVAVEMWPDTKKWRSKAFEPVLFQMQLHEFPEAIVPHDNFGHPTTSVVANYSPEDTLNPRLKGYSVVEGKRKFFRAYDVVKAMATLQSESASLSHENFADKLGCSPPTANHLIKEMIELGFIQKVNPGGKGTAAFLVLDHKALILLDMSGDNIHLDEGK